MEAAGCSPTDTLHFNSYNLSQCYRSKPGLIDDTSPLALLRCLLNFTKCLFASPHDYFHY